MDTGTRQDRAGPVERLALLAVVAIIELAIIIYLGAVLSVYVLAWILDLIGIIFD